MDWLQIIVLALVQGITEFLPISSSAHLLLPALLTDWPDQGLAFDVGVHFGSLIAVLIFFKRELRAMAVDTLRYPMQRKYTPHVDTTLKLAFATAPIAIVGLLAQDYIEAHMRIVPVIATTTIFFGLVLWYADTRRGTTSSLGWHHALFIGLAQVLALAPGTSRSGITISAALLLGLSRTTAARFSFLLAIPTIAAAQLLLSIDLGTEAIPLAWGQLLAASTIAGISAYCCIHFFISLVERTGMMPYVIYRLILGAGLFLLIA